MTKKFEIFKYLEAMWTPGIASFDLMQLQGTIGLEEGEKDHKIIG